MSIASEIERLNVAKQKLNAFLADNKVSVPTGARIDAMADLLAGVETGVDTSDATAKAAYILKGYTAYVNGIKITGTFVDNSTSSSVFTNIIERDISGSYNNDSVTKIGNYSFYNCISLTTATFANATSVSGNAFQGCTGLKTVSLPKVTNLYISAFYQCRALETLSLPKLTSIGGSHVFGYCSTLTALILGNTAKVCTLNNANCFDGTPIQSGTGYIYVPSSLASSYKSATNWSTYANKIRAIEDYPDITGG